MHLVKPQEAAELLHLSTSTLAKLRLTGRGPSYRKHGRSVLYDYRELEAWSNNRVRFSTSDQGIERAA